MKEASCFIDYAMVRSSTLTLKLRLSGSCSTMVLFRSTSCTEVSTGASRRGLYTPMAVLDARAAWLAPLLSAETLFSFLRSWIGSRSAWLSMVELWRFTRGCWSEAAVDSALFCFSLREMGAGFAEACASKAVVLGGDMACLSVLLPEERSVVGRPTEPYRDFSRVPDSSRTFDFWRFISLLSACWEMRLVELPDFWTVSFGVVVVCAAYCFAIISWILRTAGDCDRLDFLERIERLPADLLSPLETLSLMGAACTALAPAAEAVAVAFAGWAGYAELLLFSTGCTVCNEADCWLPAGFAGAPVVAVAAFEA